MFFFSFNIKLCYTVEKCGNSGTVITKITCIIKKLTQNYVKDI